MNDAFPRPSAATHPTAHLPTADTRLVRATSLFVTAGALTLPFPRVAQLQLIGVSFAQLSDLSFALAGVCWLASWARREIRVSLWGGLLPLSLYVAWCGLSYFATAGHGAWLFHFAAAAYLAGLFAMIGSVLAEPGRLARFVNAWAVAAYVTVALGLLGIVLFYLGVTSRAENPFLWHYGSMPQGNYPRLYVLFRNGNMLCNYLTLSIGLLLSFGDRLSPTLRRLRPSFFVGAVCVALFTLSPGLGGLGLTGAAWASWSYGAARPSRWRWPLMLAGGGAAVFFVIASVVALEPPGQGDFGVGPVDVALAGSVRIVLWSAALKTGLASPVVGNGLGQPPAWVTDPRTFTPRDQWTDDLLHRNFEPRAMDAHDMYLSVFAQLGIVGLALLAWFAVCVYRQLLRLPEGDVRRGLSAALLGGVIHHGFFASLEECRQVWISCGLVLAASGGMARQGAGLATNRGQVVAAMQRFFGSGETRSRAQPGNGT